MLNNENNAMQRNCERTRLIVGLPGSCLEIAVGFDDLDSVTLTRAEALLHILSARKLIKDHFLSTHCSARPSSCAQAHSTV
jgi:hypothetical protein